MTRVGAAVVAGLAQAVEDLRGAVGMVLEKPADVALEGVELAGACTGHPGAEPGFVEPAGVPCERRAPSRGRSG